MTRRVLVTGASGFVGRHVLEPLLDRGFEVHCAGRRRPEAAGVTHHSLDLMDRAAVHALLGQVQPSHILHLAWYVEHGAFWSAPQNLDWVAATLDLARMAQAQGVQRFVATGTCMEYDWSDNGPQARTESDGLGPRHLYSEAKAATFRLLSQFFCSTPDATSFAWGRLFYLFGQGENEARLVPALIKALHEGRRFSIRSGQLVRDFMPASEAGLALAALLDSACMGAVNIASGSGLSLADLAHTLAAGKDQASLLDIGANPPAPGEPDRLVGDIEKLMTHTSYHPRTMPIEALTALARVKS